MITKLLPSKYGMCHLILDNPDWVCTHFQHATSHPVLKD